MYPWLKSYATYMTKVSKYQVMTKKHDRKEKERKKKERRKETPTNKGTSLLIINCTLPLKLALLLKLTRYFNENVSDTCWFISIVTPLAPESSSSLFEDLPLPLDEDAFAVFGFLEGLEVPFAWEKGNSVLTRANKGKRKVLQYIPFSSSSYYPRLPHSHPHPHRPPSHPPHRHLPEV